MKTSCGGRGISMTTGVYIGKFYPFHNGHGYVIEEAVKQLDKLIILICWEDGQTIPLELRVKQIEDWCKSKNILHKVEIDECLDSLKIGVEYDGESRHDLSKVWSDYLMSRYVFDNITHFVGSEPYVKLMADFQKINHLTFDRMYDISSRKIRGDFAMINSIKDYIPKIAIVGIESSGKSTLVRELSKILPDIEVVDEYGRIYCEANTNISNHINHEEILVGQDFINIALGHNRMVISAHRKALARNSNLVLCDTEHVVTSRFLSYYDGYENEKLYLENMSKSQHYDLVIYLEPLELELDGTRLDYNEKERNEQNFKLKTMIKNVHKNIVFIYTDDLKERVELTLEEINKYKRGDLNENEF